MEQLDTHIDQNSENQYIKKIGLSLDETRLLKEIRRLKYQMHIAKYLDKSKQRTEFLRKEISILELQLSYLNNQTEHS